MLAAAALRAGAEPPVPPCCDNAFKLVEEFRKETSICNALCQRLAIDKAIELLFEIGVAA